MAGFSRLAEEIGFRGSLVTAAVARFADPDGSIFERDVVHHPGAVVVVPVLDGGRAVLMVRQYRAAIDRVLLEVPAGKRDVEGEPVDVTARRELAEEVGMEAERVELLARFYNSPGFCDEHTHLFVATGLTPCPPSAQGIEEQHMTVEEVALDDVLALIAGGELVDAKSIIGLCLVQESLRRGAAA